MERKKKDGEGGAGITTLVSLMRNRVLPSWLRERINSI